MNRLKELHERDIAEKTQENQRLQSENEKLLSELAAAEKRAHQLQDRATLAEGILREEMEASLQGERVEFFLSKEQENSFDCRTEEAESRM